MRLVTWNCNGAFRRKFERLDAFDADILVIQECEDPAQSTQSYQIWDKRRRVRNHAECIRELADSGFQSLYHRSTGEAQGQERGPTFFLHRSEEKPYHIDYVFAHEERLKDVDMKVIVGFRCDWIDLSDHMPLVVDLPEIHPAHSG